MIGRRNPKYRRKETLPSWLYFSHEFSKWYNVALPPVEPSTNTWTWFSFLSFNYLTFLCLSFLNWDVSNKSAFLINLLWEWNVFIWVKLLEQCMRHNDDSINVDVIKLLGHVWLSATPQSVACQVPLSMGFPRQEYWSGLSFLYLGNLLNPGTEPAPLTFGRWILYLWAIREA